MLFMKILLAGRDARVVKIDSAQAEALPGVGHGLYRQGHPGQRVRDPGDWINPSCADPARPKPGQTSCGSRRSGRHDHRRVRGRSLPEGAI